MPLITPRLDLKSRVAATVLLLFLSAIWLLSYLTISRLQEDFAQVLADQQLSAVSHVAEEIEQKLKLRLDALQLVARDVTPDMLKAPERIRQLLEARPLLSALLTNGVVVIGRDGVGIVDHPSVAGRAGSSYRDLEYFEDVMRTGQPAIGKPRMGRFTQRLGVALAVPVRDGAGHTVAVLAGFAALSDPSLFGRIAEAKVGRTGWLAVSDARHRMIVAINDPKRVLQPFPAPGVNKMLDRYAAGEEGAGISMNSQGREVLTAARQIGKTGWFAQSVLPTDEAFEPLQDIRQRTYAIAGALSLAASLIVWLLIKHLFRPLTAATAEIRQMAEAKESPRELPVERADEIGDLITSFNLLFRQRRALHEELERQARTDALTELPNRRAFFDKANQELARALRYDSPLTLLMLDVDHFKHINDSLGHEGGDRVLKALASTCRATLREVDTIGRVGGEEFAVVLPETGLEAGIDIAQRLRAALAATDNAGMRFTASIGVAAAGPATKTIEQLIGRADAALYLAKREGRNCVRVAPPEDAV